MAESKTVSIRIDAVLQRRITKARKEANAQSEMHTISNADALRHLLELGLACWERRRQVAKNVDE
ncbi:MAG: hypothetical protein OXM01_09875 [Gemmatimonadota bacterium]|nr:hypothetical protein [Gemmatimonadota bacterium]